MTFLAVPILFTSYDSELSTKRIRMALVQNLWHFLTSILDVPIFCP